jgi:hypothetical protein
LHRVAYRAPVVSGGFRGGGYGVVSHNTYYGSGSGGGQASSNWRYITDEDRIGPRKEEHIISTTLAKERYLLSTSDLCGVEGLRHKGERSTLTMYYVNDLKAAAIAKFGQSHFDNHVPAGRELSGVAQKARDAKAAKERAQADKKNPYAVVPPEHLATNCSFDKLQDILIRVEGGWKEPRCKTMQACVDRILASGKYDVEMEAKLMAERKAAEDARLAQAAIERARYQAAREAAEELQRVKSAAAAARKEKLLLERMELFEAGELSIDDLTWDDIKESLKRLGVKGKELVGKKDELKARLKVAVAAKAVEKRV